MGESMAMKMAELILFCELRLNISQKKPNETIQNKKCSAILIQFSL